MMLYSIFTINIVLNKVNKTEKDFANHFMCTCEALGEDMEWSRDNLTPMARVLISPAGVPNPCGANVTCGDMVPLGVPYHWDTCNPHSACIHAKG